MADNFIPFVPFDAFSPGIPTDNHSLWVQHEDRIVLDFVEERPILFFAVPMT